MQLLEIPSFLIKEKFNKHSFFKEQLLNSFKQEKNFLSNLNSTYDDNINRLDWDKSSDFERPWVKLIINDLKEHFKKSFNKINYSDVLIKKIWFQQYEKDGTHGWHIHGDNYTGVYYVSFKKTYAKTQIEIPLKNEIIEIDAEEGDIVLFPSFIVHRSSIQKIEETKTIISFNLELIK